MTLVFCCFLTLLLWGRKALPLSFVVLFSLLPQFLSQSLVAIDDDSWQEQLTRVILERISYFNDDNFEKVCMGVWQLQGGKLGWRVVLGCSGKIIDFRVRFKQVNSRNI